MKELLLTKPGPISYYLTEESTNIDIGPIKVSSIPLVLFVVLLYEHTGELMTYVGWFPTLSPELLLFIRLLHIQPGTNNILIESIECSSSNLNNLHFMLRAEQARIIKLRRFYNDIYS